MNAAAKVGTAIYYRGDMANRDGFGNVVEYIPSAKWGDDVKIRLDDGREMTIPAMMVKDTDSGNGSTRFVTLRAYEERRQQYIAEMQEWMTKSR